MKSIVWLLTYSFFTVIVKTIVRKSSTGTEAICSLSEMEWKIPEDTEFGAVPSGMWGKYLGALVSPLWLCLKRRKSYFASQTWVQVWTCWSHSCGSPAWQEHVVEQNHLPHGGKQREKEEETRVPWSPLRSHPRESEDLPVCSTSERFPQRLRTKPLTHWLLGNISDINYSMKPSGGNEDESGDPGEVGCDSIVRLFIILCLCGYVCVCVHICAYTCGGFTNWAISHLLALLFFQLASWLIPHQPCSPLWHWILTCFGVYVWTLCSLI